MDDWRDEEADVDDGRWRGDVHLADWPEAAAGPEYQLLKVHLAAHVWQEECPLCQGRGWIAVIE